jgi:hypothetical protein
VPKRRPYQATCAYSWIRPPSRSRRRTPTVAAGDGEGTLRSGDRLEAVTTATLGVLQPSLLTIPTAAGHVTLVSEHQDLGGPGAVISASEDQQDRSASVIVVGHAFVQNVRRDITSWWSRSWRTGGWWSHSRSWPWRSELGVASRLHRALAAAMQQHPEGGPAWPKTGCAKGRGSARRRGRRRCWRTRWADVWPGRAGARPRWSAAGGDAEQRDLKNSDNGAIRPQPARSLAPFPLANSYSHPDVFMEK